jgi:hypothetical protein
VTFSTSARVSFGIGMALLLAFLLDVAVAMPPTPPSEAQSVIAQVRRAAAHRDVRSLGRLLTHDFSFYGKGSLAVLKSDPAVLENLVKLIDAGCLLVTTEPSKPWICCRAHIGSPGTLFDEARFFLERGRWKLDGIERFD